MCNRDYDVRMRTSIGSRYGMMSVSIENSKISGTLVILNKSNPFSGNIDENGDCHIQGKVTTLMRTIPYHATGRITKEKMDLRLESEQEVFDLCGTASAHVPAIKKEESI